MTLKVEDFAVDAETMESNALMGVASERWGDIEEDPVKLEAINPKGGGQICR